jgi:hypothetical protein
LVPTNTAGNWFQPIEREIFCTKKFHTIRQKAGNWFQPIQRENKT